LSLRAWPARRDPRRALPVSAVGRAGAVDSGSLAAETVADERRDQPTLLVQQRAQALERRRRIG
jgi:hypothetical protein